VGACPRSACRASDETPRLDWVAAWFACHEHSDADGVLWWFNQTQLEEVIAKKWVAWGVPTRAEHLNGTYLSVCDQQRLGLNQRALEASAFNANGQAWISKLHSPSPAQGWRPNKVSRRYAADFERDTTTLLISFPKVT
jgi:hypothetical protein